jgi:hypothetical protein
LDVNYRALNDALKTGGRLGILGSIGDQIVQLGFKVGDQPAAQLLQIDVARLHYRGGILIFDQGKQQVLERCVFVMSLIGERERPMKRLLKAAGERGHSMSSSSNIPHTSSSSRLRSTRLLNG